MVPTKQSEEEISTWLLQSELPRNLLGISSTEATGEQSLSEPVDATFHHLQATQHRLISALATLGPPT